MPAPLIWGRTAGLTRNSAPLTWDSSSPDPPRNRRKSPPTAIPNQTTHPHAVNTKLHPALRSGSGAGLVRVWCGGREAAISWGRIPGRSISLPSSRSSSRPKPPRSVPSARVGAATGIPVLCTSRSFRCRNGAAPSLKTRGFQFLFQSSLDRIAFSFPLSSHTFPTTRLIVTEAVKSDGSDVLMQLVPPKART